MKILYTRSYRREIQLMICLLLITVVAGIAFAFRELIGYKVVALVLLMTVSIIAMLFAIVPVLISATVSALVWNFFFIPPVYTFHIDNTEDMLLFAMYFVIALVNVVLSNKIHSEQQKAREKEEKERQLAFHTHLLNSLSHELRTPISTIIGAADTLRESEDRLSTNQKNTLLAEIETAGLRLNRQVENLLHSGRMKSGSLEPRLDWCDTEELIFQVIGQVDHPKHTIRFSPDKNMPFVRTDRGLAEHILHNLLHNAVTYTPAGSTIEISSTVENQVWKLEVCDNGNGISEDLHESLFHAFFRGPEAKTGGTGLGLSIVKGFTEVLGGTVEARPNKPHGLRIILSFPVELSYMNQLNNE